MTQPYQPWLHAARFPRLLVARLRLPRGSSWWLPADQAVVLDDRLGQAESRCRLAHELVHVERQDEYLEDQALDARREARVQQVAARRLIGHDDLVDALRWTNREAELADELWVDVPTVVARLAGLSDAEKNDIEQRLWAPDEGAA